ncbi:MAG: hypothetical protein JKY03_06360 [Aureispira sp.]|nr:hypothetical protein [Aureispira sp.]
MIQAIKLIHTNPSMGPYERIVSYHLTNSEAHKAEFDQLLDGTKVNEAFDLKIYLAAYKNKDKARIEHIFKANYNGRLNEGETISVLEITLVGGLDIRISDLRQTQLSGYYADFIRYLVKNGYREEFSKNERFPKTKEKERPPIIKRIDEINDTDISI